MGTPRHSTTANTANAAKTVAGTVYVTWDCNGWTPCTTAVASTAFYRAKAVCMGGLAAPADHPDCFDSLGTSYTCFSRETGTVVARLRLVTHTDAEPFVSDFGNPPSVTIPP